MILNTSDERLRGNLAMVRSLSPRVNALIKETKEQDANYTLENKRPIFTEDTRQKILGSKVQNNNRLQEIESDEMEIS